MAKRTIITSALPYANGPIHIGHLVEYIQTDILVRFFKLSGHDAVYCCADDTHGAPIEIKASQLGITSEELIATYHKEHTRDFADYHIHFDSYYTTNSSENERIATHIFLKLKEKGLIYQKEMELTYCNHCKRFLPDRYVKGECPKCNAKDQYGDQCEKCNSAYKTIDLINPYCTICKNTPIRKKSTHYFFKLSAFSEKLEAWLKNNKQLQPEIRNQILNWITSGLEDWCISRDGPYFGFKIPGEIDKYFYVWLDAPIGYISSFAHFLKDKETYSTLQEWNNSKIIHVIGKDIIYFHLLFWPAMLMAADIELPENVLVHGFLNVNGEKMSKSRGTFLTAEEFLRLLPDKNPELLRYYYASNLSRTMTDINLDLQDFTDKINNELVSNIANFIYRTLSFVEKHFDGKIPALPKDTKNTGVLAEAKILAKKTADSYNKYELREAVKNILSLSTFGNKYFQDNEPWKLVKEDKEKAAGVLAVAANIAKDLVLLLKPILPEACRQYESQLNLANLNFDDLGRKIENHQSGKARIILQRIPLIKLNDKEEKAIEGKEENKKEKAVGGKEKEANEKEGKEPAGNDASGNFALLNIKVAKITEVRRHPNAEKLYIETIDLGTEKRQIVSGLVPYYKEEELIGKHILVVTNLKPANLRGVESNGMLLAGQGHGGGAVGLLLAPESAPGTQITLEGSDEQPNTKEITIEQFAAVKIELKDGFAYCNGKHLLAGSHKVNAEKVTEGPVR